MVFSHYKAKIQPSFITRHLGVMVLSFLVNSTNQEGIYVSTLGSKNIHSNSAFFINEGFGIETKWSGSN